MRLTFVPLLLTCAAVPLTAPQIFVNAAAGADTNSGTRERPLRSLSEAARRVNSDKISKLSEAVVAPGLYVVSETALFQNSKHTIQLQTDW